MHLTAVSSRCRVVRVSRLPGHLTGEYDLDAGVIRILSTIPPSECPRIAAEAVARAEIDRSFPELSCDHRERLALRIGPIMARFAEDVEVAGGKLAFFKAEHDHPQRHKWRGMTNGSQMAGRPCANPTCDYRCAPGSVQFAAPEHLDSGQVACKVVTDCEFCGLWTYYELANAANKPSGEMVSDVMPRELGQSEKIAYMKDRGVVGTIYID